LSKNPKKQGVVLYSWLEFWLCYLIILFTRFYTIEGFVKTLFTYYRLFLMSWNTRVGVPLPVPFYTSTAADNSPEESSNAGTHCSFLPKYKYEHDFGHSWYALPLKFCFFRRWMQHHYRSLAWNGSFIFADCIKLSFFLQASSTFFWCVCCFMQVQTASLVVY